MVEGKQFFFEKKNQKTFDIMAYALRRRARRWTAAQARTFSTEPLPDEAALGGGLLSWSPSLSTGVVLGGGCGRAACAANALALPTELIALISAHSF
jgi:hypothetical protein